MGLFLKGLSFKFSTQIEDFILKDVSFHFDFGKCYSISGKSGEGKSTLAKLILGYLKPCAGEISLDGDTLNERPSRNVLFVSQEDDLFPWMRVGDQLLALSKMGREEVRRSLEAFDIADVYSLYPYELSVGMKKRASIVRCLLINPRVLILDESLSSLDSEMRGVVMTRLRQWVNENKTLLIGITHQESEENFFDIKLQLRSGTIHHSR